MTGRDSREALTRAGKMISQLLVALQREQERSRNYKNLLKGATKACEIKNLQLKEAHHRLTELTKVQYLECPPAVSAETHTPPDSSFVQLVRLSQ